MSILQELLDDGVFVDPQLIKDGIDETLLHKAVKKYGDDLLVIDEALINKLKQEEKSKVKVLWSYDSPSKKRTYNDFVKALQYKFKELERILKSRQELTNAISISRLKTKVEQESVSLIALIVEKSETANGHIIFTVEDMTGQTKVLISKNREKLHSIALDIQLDEVIGFTGNGNSDILFADSIIFPDVPLTKELKKSPVDEYALFIGDIEFGATKFLKKEFERFLLWLNGKVGNEEQRKIAKKIKYCIVIGDVVDGVGIYPGQEEDLDILDVKDQYKEAARYFRQFPKHIEIIIIPGNHDVGRLAEPQEKIPIEYAKELYEIENITMLSNPSRINIGATETFPGFDLLLYHGGSLIYYSDNIPSIRAKGGQKRSDLIMRYYLQRRHLAPTHNAALTVPEAGVDHLLIKQVPDFLVTGHIHRLVVTSYRNVTLINSSCWTDISENQIKRGLEPQPARAIIINLKTRKPQVLNFYKGRQKKSEEDKKK